MQMQELCCGMLYCWGNEKAKVDVTVLARFEDTTGRLADSERPFIQVMRISSVLLSLRQFYGYENGGEQDLCRINHAHIISRPFLPIKSFFTRRYGTLHLTTYVELHMYQI